MDFPSVERAPRLVISEETVAQAQLFRIEVREDGHRRPHVALRVGDRDGLADSHGFAAEQEPVDLDVRRAAGQEVVAGVVMAQALSGPKPERPVVIGEKAPGIGLVAGIALPRSIIDERLAVEAIHPSGRADPEAACLIKQQRIDTPGGQTGGGS